MNYEIIIDDACKSIMKVLSAEQKTYFQILREANVSKALGSLALARLQKQELVTVAYKVIRKPSRTPTAKRPYYNQRISLWTHSAKAPFAGNVNEVSFGDTIYERDNLRNS